MNDTLPRTTEPVWFGSLSPAEKTLLASTDDDFRYRTPDVLVVGGGLIGLSIGYFLSERGIRVQVIETSGLVSGASGANAGGIWPNDQGPLHSPDFQALALLSRDMWARLSLRLEFDFDWRVNGLLNVNAERIGPSTEDAARALQSEGYAVQSVDSEQISQLEPALRAGLTCGLHYPSEAHLHPVKAALSLFRAARARGLGIRTDVTATRLSVRDGQVVAVETTAGEIHPRNVVAATGWSAEWLKEAIAPLPPLRPVSGQLISTAPQPPLLKGTVAHRFLVFQLRSGEVVTGPDVAESDRLTPDPALSGEFAAAARDLIPALRDVPFDRAWRGIRPATPDGLPVIDRAANIENLWLALGHFKNGVLLAPGTGNLLSEWIDSGTQPEELRPFVSNRFFASRG